MGTRKNKLQLDCPQEIDGTGITSQEDSLDALLDLLPEFRVYRDEGCDYSRSCLNCPLPL